MLPNVEVWDNLSIKWPLTETTGPLTVTIDVLTGRPPAWDRGEGKVSWDWFWNTSRRKIWWRRIYILILMCTKGLTVHLYSLNLAPTPLALISSVAINNYKSKWISSSLSYLSLITIVMGKRLKTFLLSGFSNDIFLFAVFNSKHEGDSVCFYLENFMLI